jgi:hypothetical protein
MLDWENHLITLSRIPYAIWGGLEVEASKQLRTREQERRQAVYEAEHNPGNVLHDAAIVFTVFALYTIFLFMGRRPPDEDDT